MDIQGKLVFSSGKTGDYDIWSLDLFTQQLIQLTSGSHWNDSPKWSPDGKKIIFISNRTDTPEIWLMDEDGSSQTRITNTGRWHNTPDWSPDGKRIVFCANYDGNVDIYIMNIDGSGLTRITDYPGMDFAPQFSPDGGQIIFTSQRSGNDDIWADDLKTQEFRQLTTYEEKDFSPAFSPDGSLIAFVCGQVELGDEENSEIYIMDKNGGDRRRVVGNLGTGRYVSWSPDGNFLIYTSSSQKSIAEKMIIMELEKMAGVQVDFDRSSLEDVIDSEPKLSGILKLLPKGLIRKFYSDEYSGVERHPDWKF